MYISVPLGVEDRVQRQAWLGCIESPGPETLKTAKLLEVGGEQGGEAYAHVIRGTNQGHQILKPQTQYKEPTKDIGCTLRSIEIRRFR
jgi:hypothetical protein